MKKLAIVIIALAAPLAHAEDAATAKPAEAALGAETRAWLQLQASGEASVATPATTNGEVAERVYQRYLDSFTHEIPEKFERESLKTEGGGGSE